MMIDPHNEPHDDEPSTFAEGRLAGILGFVLGCAVGWAAWHFLVVPFITPAATVDNPDAAPADWLYYGTLVGCMIVALFIVAVIGEFIGSRRKKARR